MTQIKEITLYFIDCFNKDNEIFEYMLEEYAEDIFIVENYGGDNSKEGYATNNEGVFDIFQNANYNECCFAENENNAINCEYCQECLGLGEGDMINDLAREEG